MSPYDGLNLGFHVGDIPDSVAENRRRLCQLFALNSERLTSPFQRHTAEVAVLNDQERIGSGSTPGTGFAGEGSFDPCDALITKMRNAPLLLHFADCVPVVVTAGGDEPAIAVIHAGRKGLVAGVIENAIEGMKRVADIDTATAAIGPSIGPCCYEVDTKTAAAFRDRFGNESEDEGYLDLRFAAEAALRQSGIQEEKIYTLGLCTSCDDNFYSYRRDGVTGRHGAIAWIGGGGPARRLAP